MQREFFPPGALAEFYLFCSLVGVSDGRFDASSIAAAGEAMLIQYYFVIVTSVFLPLQRLVFIVRPLGRLLRLRLLLRRRRRRRRGEQQQRQQRQGLHRLGVRRAAKV